MPHGSHPLRGVAARSDANLRHRPPEFDDLAGHRRLVFGPNRRGEKHRVECRHLLQRGEHAGRELKLWKGLDRERVQPGRARGERCQILLEVSPADAAGFERGQRRQEDSCVEARAAELEVLEAGQPRERLAAVVSEAIVTHGVARADVLQRQELEPCAVADPPPALFREHVGRGHPEPLECREPIEDVPVAESFTAVPIRLDERGASARSRHEHASPQGMPVCDHRQLIVADVGPTIGRHRGAGHDGDGRQRGRRRRHERHEREGRDQDPCPQHEPGPRPREDGQEHQQ